MIGSLGIGTSPELAGARWPRRLHFSHRVGEGSGNLRAESGQPIDLEGLEFSGEA